MITTDSSGYPRVAQSEQYLSVELVYDEVTQRSFEEILLRIVLQQWVIHGISGNLTHTDTHIIVYHHHVVT